MPLILKPPASFKLVQRSINQVVDTVDIAPTLSQFAQFPSRDSDSFQGRSLVPLLQSAAQGSPRTGYSESLYPRSSFGWHSLHGTETERYHYIEAPREELYDLDQDPGETRNIVGQKPTVASVPRENLHSLAARYGSPAGRSRDAPVDMEKLRELRSLGYLGGSTAQPLQGDAPGAADPKDRIGFYNRVIRATELAEDRRFQESNAFLEQAVAEDPKAYLPPFLRGENAMSQRQYREAMDHYRRALELNPHYDLAAVGMGRAALAERDAAGALKAFQWALELNPQNYLVKLAMAEACERLNRLPDAVNLEKEVLAAHPADGKANSDYGVTLVRMRRYQDGLAALQMAGDLGYRTAITFNFLGTAQLAGGHAEQAVRAYEEAIRLDAKYSAPYGNLALFYLKAGENEKAQQYYKKACLVDSVLCRDLAAHFRRGSSHE